MIRDILLVGAGSFFGGIGRYLISLLMRSVGNGFPWGTFTVNILGSLIIGALWGITSRNANPVLSLFFMVGFCGGFTTFSTFSKESLMLLQTGNYTTFAIYATCSFVIGIVAVLSGLMITK